VGRAALEGLHGVKKVEKGFRGAREINTVTFDPAEITVAKMVEALTRAGTYRGTAMPPIDASLPGVTETATFALG
jgi:copper chaperone CopZ